MNDNASRKRRIRPLLLILLWVWAILVFLVVDLFLDVDDPSARSRRARLPPRREGS